MVVDSKNNYFLKSVQKQPYAEVIQNRCFAKISQQDNFCVGVYFNKVACLKVCNFVKKRLQHRRFPVNIAKCLRTTFL